METEDLESFLLAELSKKDRISLLGKEKISAFFKKRIEIERNPDGHPAKEIQNKVQELQDSLSADYEEIIKSRNSSRFDVSESLFDIYLGARFRHGRHKKLTKFRGASIKEFKLESSGASKNCRWCKQAQKEKFSSSEDVESLIQNNCTCKPCCTCFLYPISPF